MSELARNYKRLAITKEQAHEMRVYIEKIYNQTIRKTKTTKIYNDGRKNKPTGTMFEVIFSRDVKNNGLNLKVIPHIMVRGKLMTPPPKDLGNKLGATYTRGHFLMSVNTDLALNMGSTMDSDYLAYKYDAETRTNKLQHMINSSLSVIEQGGEYSSFGYTMKEKMEGFGSRSNPLFDGKGEFQDKEDWQHIHRDILNLYKKENGDIKESIATIIGNSNKPIHKVWSELLKDPKNVIEQYTTRDSKTEYRANLRNFYILMEYMVKEEEREKVAEEYALILDKGVNNIVKSYIVKIVSKIKEEGYSENAINELVWNMLENYQDIAQVDLEYIEEEVFNSPKKVNEFARVMIRATRTSTGNTHNRKELKSTVNNGLRSVLLLNDEDSEELLDAKLNLAIALESSESVTIRDFGNSGRHGYNLLEGQRRDEDAVKTIIEKGHSSSVYSELNTKVNSYKYFIDRAYDLLPIEKATEFVTRAYNFEGESDRRYGCPYTLTFPNTGNVTGVYWEIKQDYGERYDIDFNQYEYYDYSGRFESIEWFTERVKEMNHKLFEEGLSKYMGELNKDPKESLLPKEATEYQFVNKILLPELEEEVKREKARIAEEEEESRKPLNRIRKLFNL